MFWKKVERKDREISFDQARQNLQKEMTEIYEKINSLFDKGMDENVNNVNMEGDELV